MPSSTLCFRGYINITLIYFCTVLADVKTIFVKSELHMKAHYNIFHEIRLTSLMRMYTPRLFWPISK